MLYHMGFRAPLFICLMQFIGCISNDILIGVLLESSSIDHRFVEAAKDFIESDFHEDASIKVSIAEIGSVDSGGNLLNLTLTACSLLKEGVHGILSHADCPSARVLEGFLEDRDVPVVLSSTPGCNLLLPQGFFRLGPTPEDLQLALYDFCTIQGATAEVIIYDRVADLSFINIISEQKPNTKKVSLRVEEQLSPFQQQLLLDLASTDKNIVLLVFLNTLTASKLLEMAVSLGLNTPVQTWVVVCGDPLGCPSYSFKDWQGGNLFLVGSQHQSLDQMFCPQHYMYFKSRASFNITSVESYFMRAFAILINEITKSKNENNRTKQSLSTTSCALSNKKVDSLAHLKPGENSTNETSCYKEDDNNEMSHINFWAVDADNIKGESLRAQWTPDRRFIQYFKPLVVNAPNNLRNRTLKVGVVRGAPYVTVDYDKNNKPIYTGFCIEIVEVLSSVLNFSIEYVDGGERYGNKGKDGQWTGMIGQVMRKEVDFAATAFHITEERESVVDFTHPINTDTSAFLLKRPQGGPEIVRIFLPYHMTVWTAIFASVAIVGLLLFAVRLCLAKCSVKQNVEMKTSSTGPFVADNLWFAYGTYLEQSMDNYPDCQSGRFLVVFWWVFTITMSATYTANLVAYLTVNISERPISTLKELADDPNVLPIILPGNSLKDLFRKASPASTYGRLWAKMQLVPSPFPTTSQEALKLVNTGHYALINDVSVLAFLASHHCDQYVIGQEHFRPVGMAFALQKGSEYMEHFNTKFAKMEESGLMQKWRTRWWAPVSGCTSSAGPTSGLWRSMGLESLAGAILVLVGAVGASLVALGLEVYLTRARRGGVRRPTGGQQNAKDKP